MNKKYMDFVPARSTAKRVVKPAIEEKAATKKKSATKAIEPKTTKKQVSKKDELTLGVVEDFSDNTKENASKREVLASSKDTAKEIKAKRVGLKAEKKESNSGTGLKTAKAEGTFKTPIPQFINQDRIVKRPLSKNTYQKKVVAPEEKSKGPVTIISKPDKQTHGGLIITIILTVILGAAAGTIAFLLLPK
ncbi:MAG: hypothetical protein Q4F61_00865 [Candidatus Saccharibacteria bacterium]|nr:hypothetical protein [Candidatus Saccharibacteria bacterium]